MLKITFKEIDKEIEKQIVEIWGNWVTEYGCLHYGDGCYSLAAIYDGKPVGFISTYPVQLPVPLQMYSDAYIDDLEVHEDFRRQGIAREMLSMTESWAKAYGYHQIRSWSSDDKKEAIPMWYSLGYGVCPAIMRGISVIKEFIGKPVYGFYVSKVL
ncbi:MAG: GNAT family N-acetyltransferase [Lachnospiraceae bacterium]|nr:GNAT family N-acetyltransferase [Lachnospiraceae bacterium]